jgi:hypothetical protein
MLYMLYSATARSRCLTIIIDGQYLRLPTAAAVGVGKGGTPQQEAQAQDAATHLAPLLTRQPAAG